MKGRRSPLAIRRADPTLKTRGKPADFARPAAASVLRVSLAALFSAILVLPRLRTLRRTRAWNWLRLGALVIAATLAATSAGWWRAAALVFALLALVLRRTADPDRERRLQRMHGAEYFLNGGEWGGTEPNGGSHGLAPGTRLYLLLRGAHLLLVPRDRDGEVHAAFRVEAIERILVDGRDYLPVYVSEAKQPPVRESDIDRHAVSDLMLKMSASEPLRFLYRGAFAGHLAETAAHAIFSVRSSTAA